MQVSQKNVRRLRFFLLWKWRYEVKDHYRCRSFPALLPHDATAVTCPGGVKRSFPRGTGCQCSYTNRTRPALHSASHSPCCALLLGLTCGVGDPAWGGGGTGARAKVFLSGEVCSLSLGVFLRVRKLTLGCGQTVSSCLAGRAGTVLLLSLICGRCLLMVHPLIERPCLWVSTMEQNWELCRWFSL